MIRSFSRFNELWTESQIKTADIRLTKNIKSFRLYFFSEIFSFNQSQIQNIKETQVMIVTKCIEETSKKTFFIFCFMNSLVIIDEFSINILQNILSTNPNFPIYFLSDTKNVFESHITIENSLFNCDENFEKEIANFNESTQFIFKNKSELLFGSIIESIKSVIAAYLIKQGYVKLKKQVLNDFSLKFDKNLSKQKWNENDYIVLRNIGFGSSFIVELIYLIEKDELYALKKPYSYINEEEKLIEREIKNYLSIDYPLLPKLYGTANNKNL